ncbi:MAG: hypothetical protein R6U19_06390 [Bacteroidales bacterium]
MPDYIRSNTLFSSPFAMVSEDSIRRKNFSLNVYLLKQEKDFPEEDGDVQLGRVLGNS